MPKLNQIIALSAGKKADAHKTKTDAYQVLQKTALLDGITRSYKPRDEDGDQLPSESKTVQIKVNQQLENVRNAMVDLFDIVATQDFANTLAKASVVVDEKVLLKDIPVTYLLFMEKQLVDIHTFVDKLPTLDPSKEWEYDRASDLYKTKPAQTIKTKKVMKNHVKAHATDKFPAQVDTYTEDVLTGYWTTVEFSGAIPAAEKNALLTRVKKLQEAVKCAREEANGMSVDVKKVGADVFRYLLGK